MKKLAIKAESISKQYRLGEVGTGTLSNDLNRFWYKIRGKEDPYLKIGEVNDRTTKGSSNYVWALKDINFEVKQGEVLGVIGRNGAGKSTLLKLLSKVTKPSNGSFKVNGRIASLLEVGTGFNQEMTGRENIYLNGAILGMRKEEIKKKFDEIVAFSGVEKYIDTPVKRYSSGMYVRLAFAVAAHLESEILIVDEVLSVGDAEFQEKCLGKMRDISKGEARTVLFVSHNMAAVKKLCTRSILLANGEIALEGETNDVIDYYFENNQFNGQKGIYENNTIKTDDSGIVSLTLLDKKNKNRTEFGFDEPITIKTKIKVNESHLNANLGLRVIDKSNRIVFTSEIKFSNYIKNAGFYEFEVKLPNSLLAPNKYNLNFWIYFPRIKFIDLQENCLSFGVIETASLHDFYQGRADCGSVVVDCEWTKN